MLKKNVIISLATMSVLVLLTVLIAMPTINPTDNAYLASNAVEILGQYGGGSGVVLYSTPVSSAVLTNRHVCDSIAHKGTVFSDTSEMFAVINYRKSLTHDLCEILVAGDLKGGVEIASSSPIAYSNAIVVGHPHLLPTVITTGHFGKKMIVTIMGASLPLQAQTVSALIAPGSSGSAVYNANGELSGLVFAGSGDISFGLIVPLEYIKIFLETELKTLEVKFITPDSDSLEGLSSPNRSPSL